MTVGVPSYFPLINYGHMLAECIPGNQNTHTALTQQFTNLIKQTYTAAVIKPGAGNLTASRTLS